jgi:hypothetical protein
MLLRELSNSELCATAVRSPGLLRALQWYIPEIFDLQYKMTRNTNGR